MTVGVSITFDRSQQRKIQRLLNRVPKAMPKAMKRALNQTGTTVRVRVVRAVAGNINVAQNKLFQRGNKRRPITQPVRATKTRLSEHIAVGFGRVPLGRFGVRQTWKKGRSGGRLRKFVSYRIDKTGSRKKIDKVAFVAKSKSGFLGVWRRLGKRRKPLAMLFGPSVPQVAQNHPKVQAVLRTDASDLLIKNVGQKVQDILDKGGR